MADRRRSTTTRTRATTRRERPTRERVAPRVTATRTGRGRSPSPARAPRGGTKTAPRAPGASARPAAPVSARGPASKRVIRRRRALVGSLALLALVGFLFAFVYPTRTYLTQRDEIHRSQERLEVLRRQTAELERDTRRLQGDAEVERVARERYGLVRPGETPYVIVPGAPAPTSSDTTPAPANP